MSTENTEQPTDPTAPAEEPAAEPGPRAADPTQSIAQATPPTQELPAWTPPYPTSTAYPIGTAYPTNAPSPGPAPVAPVPPTSPAHAGYDLPPPPQAPAGALPQAAPWGPPPPSAIPYPPIPPVGYAAPQRTNTSGLVLTIISGLLVFSCYFTLIGLPSFIIGIAAMTKQNTDWDSSRKLARIGWIVLGSLFALAVIAVILIIVFAPSNEDLGY